MADAISIAQMSHNLITMLNGTEIGAKLEPPPLPMSYQTDPSIWINVLWSLSFTCGLTCTFFGIRLRRWAYHYLLTTSSHHAPLRHRLSAADGLVTPRPSTMLGLLQVFFPMSVIFFYFGHLLFLIQVGVSPGLLFGSSLVLSGIMYRFSLFIDV